MSNALIQQALPAVAPQVTVPKPSQTQSASQARKVAEDFEAFFIAQTVESMFAGIQTDGPFGGGNGEQMFRSMLSQEYGKSMARGSSIGIADQVYREILKTQEMK